MRNALSRYVGRATIHAVTRADVEYLREVRRFAQTAARWERQAERRHREYMANFEELRADSRAHREALLGILDRLDGGAATA